MNKVPGAIIIEGHVQGLSNTRSLGEIGIPVIVVDKTNCIARYSKYCSKFFRCPDYISDEFAGFLIDLAQKENIEKWLLIPSNDHAVYTISKFKSDLEQYYSVISPDIKVIDQIYDKAKLLKIAENLRIPIPKTALNDQNGKSISFFPVIVKGRKGLTFYKATGKKAFIANSIYELEQILSSIEMKIDLKETITQEIIPFHSKNKTISFTAFVDHGEIKTHWIGEKVREHPIRFGTATFCRSVKKEFLVSQSTELMLELGYTGICEIEYLKDPRDNKYKLIEINPRTWLWVSLAKECGIDYIKILIDYITNSAIQYPTHYSTLYRWVNLATDIPFSFLSIAKGSLSIKEYLITFRGKIIFAAFSWKDLLPSFIFPIILILNTKKRRNNN